MNKFMDGKENVMQVANILHHITIIIRYFFFLALDLIHLAIIGPKIAPPIIAMITAIV